MNSVTVAIGVMIFFVLQGVVALYLVRKIVGSIEKI
jgi:hypothetical protein